MRFVKVRNLKIGEGIPKICVPIVGKTIEEIEEQAKEIVALSIDLVEWRCDWYENVSSREKVSEVMRELRNVLGDIPLLFTFRTAEEGGEKTIGLDEYVALNKMAIESGNMDLVDVQMLLGDDVLKQLAEYAHKYGVKIVASNHDFTKTPEQEVIVGRLQHMQELGADIAKIAVMPNTKEDVKKLLEATREVSQNEDSGPIITMAMSELGKNSRIEGEIYGSAVTFGSAKEASAPGQIPARELADFLQDVHERKFFGKKVEKKLDLL